jgi:hypothetical protein
MAQEVGGTVFMVPAISRSVVILHIGGHDEATPLRSPTLPDSAYSRFAGRRSIIQPFQPCLRQDI